MKNNQSYFDQCFSKSSAVSIVNAKNNPTPVLNYNDLPLDLFQDLNVGQLQGFIATKNCPNSKGAKSYFSKLGIKKWPNKATLNDARNDAMCLIKLAYESRNKSNIMALPSFADLFHTNQSSNCVLLS